MPITFTLEKPKSQLAPPTRNRSWRNSISYNPLFICFVTYCCIPAALIAQEREVHGIVRDEFERPLEGVQINGSSYGTSTDAFGEYTLAVLEGDSIRFSYLGYVSKSIQPSQSRIDITLNPDIITLRNVEVLGLGSLGSRSRKRRETLYETNGATSMISTKEIETRSYVNLEEIAPIVPNVSFNDYQEPSFYALTVRGITQVRDGEPPVSIVVDGVQSPFHQTFNQDFFDLESIEVSKGPQGTLYGKNAVAGAINLTTRKPTNDFTGALVTGYASGNEARVRGTFSGPIVTDKLFFRIGGSFKDRAGYDKNKNIFLDEFSDGTRDYALRGRILYDLSPKISFDLRAQSIHSDGGAWYYIQAPASNLPDDPTNSHSNTFNGQPEQNIPGNTELSGADYSLKGTINSKLGEWTSVTNYSKIDYLTQGDLDASRVSDPALFAAWTFEDTQLTGFNQEIRLTADQEKRMKYVLGFFYQKTDRDQTIDSGSDNGQGEIDRTLSFGSIQNNINSNTFAAFADISYSLTEKLESSVGLRFDHDSKDQSNPFDPSNIENVQFNRLQPKFELSYRFTDDIKVYGSYAEGYRSGGFNPPVTDDALARFQPEFDEEVSQNFELGIKTRLSEDRLQISTNLFRTTLKNEQVYVVDVNNGFSVGIFNLDKVRFYGVELDTKFRMRHNLDLGFAFGLTDSEILNASIASQFPSVKGDVFGNGGNWTGNKAPFAANYNLALSLLYTWNPDPKNRFTFYADLQNKGRQYWHPDNFDFQDPYTLVNFTIGYQHQSGLGLSLYGKNVFDIEYNAEYFAKEFSGAARDVRFPTPPAILGGELSYRF